MFTTGNNEADMMVEFALADVFADRAVTDSEHDQTVTEVAYVAASHALTFAVPGESPGWTDYVRGAAFGAGILARKDV